MRNIYEINTAAWLHRLSEANGSEITLGTVPDDELSRIGRFGMDCVWLMGVWQRSEIAAAISRNDEDLVNEICTLLPDYTPDDIIGSAYAIHDYSVDERFGSVSELLQLRQRLADRGMKLILDYVPNHTAFDHPWVSTHPEYYITDSVEYATNSPRHFKQCGDVAVANGGDPTLDPWPDVAQLNAFNADYREETVRTINSIAALCDGVRCDMAMLLLNDIFSSSWKDRAGDMPEQEYWQFVTTAVKQKFPEFIFIAEAYWDTEQQLISLGFDYSYDKRLYDRLIVADFEGAQRHTEHMSAIGGHLMHFLENHDEPRIASITDLYTHTQAARMVAATAGIALWHDGQFEGYRQKIPVHVRRGPIESVDPAVSSMYQELLGNTGAS